MAGQAQWRENWRQPSFRGAPFELDDAERTGGRRVAVHEFIQRNEPYVEDMGGMPRVFTIQGFVLGPDYQTRRDALLSALEEPGPGTLVHPFYGEITVTLNGGYTCTEGISAGGGIASFSMPFIECVSGGYPSPQVSAPHVAQQRFADAFHTLADELDAALSIAGRGQRVYDSALACVNGLLARTKAVSRGFVSPTDELPPVAEQETQAILASSGTGKALLSIMLEHEPPVAAQAATGLKSVLALVPQTPFASNSGISRAVSTANAQALERFETGCLSLRLARAYTSAIPSNMREAETMRREAIALLDALQEGASEALYAALAALRAAVIAALAQKARKSPQVARVTPSTVQPSLYLIQRHTMQSMRGREKNAFSSLPYDTIQDLAADFRQRNGIIHPGFVSPQSCEMLKEAAYEG